MYTQSYRRFQASMARLIISMLICILSSGLIVNAQDSFQSSDSTPLLYDNTSSSISIASTWSALLGVRYKVGGTKKFDREAITQLQTQIPSTLCNNIDHFINCQEATEMFLLGEGKTGITRNETKLKIPLSPYGVVIFSNIKDHKYIYRGYLPSIHHHHISVYYYEGSDEILINEYTGEATTLPYAPVISPTGRYLISAASNFSFAFSIQVWEVEYAHLNLVANYFIEKPTGQPYSAQIITSKWQDQTTLQMSLVNESNTMTDTITIAASSTDWHVVFNEAKLSVQPFHPRTLDNNSLNVADVPILQIGEKVYRDRDYRFTEIPKALKGQQFLLFDNNNTRNADSNYVRFELTRPAIIYIAIDEQATSLPGWMSDNWTPTDEVIRTDDVVVMKIYERRFEPGEVILGGNWMSPASGIRNHYLAIVTGNAQ